MENCYSCHGDKKQKGGLRLDSFEAILQGGESGPAVVPGKPEESLLVEAINFAGLEMPPTGKLSGEKVATLTRWVSLGTPWPSRDRAAHAPSDLARPTRVEVYRSLTVHSGRFNPFAGRTFRPSSHGNRHVGVLVTQSDRSISF